METLINLCNLNCIPYKEKHRIKYETYFKMGGIVNLLISPVNIKQLADVVSEAKKRNIKYKLIGFSSNLLILDSVEYGVFISTKNVTCINEECNRIDVSSGYSLSELVRLMLLRGVSGYEGLEGIPGSIGGAVVMNAGAYGYEISDKIIDVTFVDSVGRVITKPREYFDFRFRTSIFKTNTDLCILSVGFDLENENGLSKSEIANKIEVFHIARHSYQEFSYPNLGSMFSTRQDMYREILRHGVKQKFSYWFLKLLIKNPLVKRFNRKKPTNNIFNKLIFNFYEVYYPVSHKSINILINNGDVTDVDILKHMKNMQRLYKENTCIENEICIENAIIIPEDIKSYIS